MSSGIVDGDTGEPYNPTQPIETHSRPWLARGKEKPRRPRGAWRRDLVLIDSLEDVPISLELTAHLRDSAFTDAEFSGDFLRSAAKGKGLCDCPLAAVVAGQPLLAIEPARHGLAWRSIHSGEIV